MLGAEGHSMNPGKTATISLVLLSAVVLLLLVSVVQLNALEKRAVTQARQLSALGESTEKLAGQLRRLEGGGLALGASRGAAEAGCDIGQVLHPDVENYLKPRGMDWPPEGASMNGVLKRGWDSGDPKGF